MNTMTLLRFAAAHAGMLLLCGCAPVALTALGVGTATGVQHTLNGYAYRTFTLPMPQVKSAATTALNRMGMKMAGRERTEDGGELIKATANERTVEVLLDGLTPATTRMRVVVRSGLITDSATSLEIISQTERVLANGKGASS